MEALPNKFSCTSTVRVLQVNILKCIIFFNPSLLLHPPHVYPISLILNSTIKPYSSSYSSHTYITPHLSIVELLDCKNFNHTFSSFFFFQIEIIINIVQNVMKKCTHFYKAGDGRALFHLSPWTPKNKSTLPFSGGWREG